MHRLTAYISGKVQKTGYRARVVSIARDFGLKGYVQNLDDGRVKVVAEGETVDLESLFSALDIKNTMINVVDIKKEHSPATGEFDGFFKVVTGGETDQRLDVAADLLRELIAVNKDVLNEIKASRKELKETREDVTSEIKAAREELEATHEELKETRGDIRGSRDAIAGEIRELRLDLKDTLEDRLVRIESDVSQIKAKVGL